MNLEERRFTTFFPDVLGVINEMMSEVQARNDNSPLALGHFPSAGLTTEAVSHAAVPHWRSSSADRRHRFPKQLSRRERQTSNLLDLTRSKASSPFRETLQTLFNNSTTKAQLLDLSVSSFNLINNLNSRQYGFLLQNRGLTSASI